MPCAHTEQGIVPVPPAGLRKLLMHRVPGSFQEELPPPWGTVGSPGLGAVPDTPNKLQKQSPKVTELHPKTKLRKIGKNAKIASNQQGKIHNAGHLIKDDQACKEEGTHNS